MASKEKPHDKTLIIKLSARKKLKSLTELCIDVVGENILEYSKPRHHLKPKHLPGILRQKILGKLSSKIQQNPAAADDPQQTRLDAVVQMLDNEIKKFEFDARDFDGRENEVMEALACKVPGLRELQTIFLPAEGAGLCPNYQTGRVQAICRLRSLQILKIENMAVDDFSLNVFGQSLSNLIILQVNLQKATAAGVKSLAGLSNLREFQFRCYHDSGCTQWDPEQQSIIMGKCIQHLPHLRMAGPILDVLAPRQLAFHKLPTTLHQPSMLEHLVVQKKITLPQAKMLPSVKTLRVVKFGQMSGEELDLEWLLAFENVDTLSLGHLKVSDVISVLRKVGHKLKKLLLDYVLGACDLWPILHLCPDLEYFAADVAIFKYSEPANFQLPASSLRVVKIASTSCLSNFTKLPDKLFIALMSCPFLTVASFSRTEVNRENIRRVAGLVRAGQICQHLRQFDFQVAPNATAEYVCECTELAKNIAAFAPAQLLDRNGWFHL